MTGPGANAIPIEHAMKTWLKEHELEIHIPAPMDLVRGDFDGGGCQDLAILTAGGGQVRVLPDDPLVTIPAGVTFLLARPDGSPCP